MVLSLRKRGVYGRLYARARFPPPSDAVIALDSASDVLLRLGGSSGSIRSFAPEAWSRDVAFAKEMAARGRMFAVSADASELFGKSVMWSHRPGLVEPRLWNYAKQAQLLIGGIEEQGNRAFVSSAELLFWENKAFMHQRLEEVGVPTPATRILAADTWTSADFDLEPVVIKEEHSAGSSGIHHFLTAADALRFVEGYPFKPAENLIMQEVVRGATRDLRVTMVGDQVIEAASYWRIKSADALASAEWTTTATANNSRVAHSDVPPSAVDAAAMHLRTLGLRTAAFDFMWVDDDPAGTPLVLELSPLYQPNPPKPHRYADWSYKRYKASPYMADGYFSQQHLVFREIARQVLDQEMY
jgi:hypothetical protein